MGQRFRVHDLHQDREGPVRDDLEATLRSGLTRLHSAMHAETRVYTCRDWRATRGATRPHALHWNDTDVPGETRLGTISWSVDAPLLARIVEELARGESVRLFTFNSDADLCFDEVLVPVNDATTL